MPARPTIGQAELEILRYIQDHHPVTVRQVADHVFETRGHVRTTVLNVMARLVRKRHLVRRKRDGVYVYAPRVPAGQLLRTLVSDFVDKALGGSPSPFVAYLAEDARLSPDDVRQLQRLVKQLEADPKFAGRKELP
jgi:BlaI family penicillinase repressor